MKYLGLLDIVAEKTQPLLRKLVWNALSELEREQLHKPVYIISTDTLVENPVVSSWVKDSLKKIEKRSLEESLPIYPNLLTPKVSNTFGLMLSEEVILHQGKNLGGAPTD